MKCNVLIINALIFAISVVGCSKEDDATPDSIQTASPDVENTESSSARAYYFPWEYVMDVRYSRGTCSTGPGVCFKDGYGDIFSPYFVDNSSGDETGTIGMHVEGDKIHFTFFRSLEEDRFILEEDIQINDKLAQALGKRSITLTAGEYAVSYDRHKFGESFVSFTSR